MGARLTLAAETLFLTQPALSLQIKALEQELGEQLFERHGKQLYLTEAGNLLLERAAQVFGLLEQCQAEIAAFKGLQQGRIRIGTSDTNCLYLLPPVVQAFRRQYPQIDIHLTNRPSKEVATLLNQGAVDFGLITLPLIDAKLEIEHLFWRQDVLIGAPGHPLLTQAEVTLTDLVAYPLLLLEPGSTSRQLLDQLFAAAGFVPQVIDLGSIEVIKRYVAIDLGVSIVPAIAIAEEVKVGRLQAREVPFLQGRAVGLVKRRTGYLSPASRKFLELLHLEIANLDA